MNEKRPIWLPIALMLVFAATRWPGLMPLNFSAAYALLFCAGVYLPRHLWWLPLVTMGLTDLALNIYYSLHYHINAFQLTQLANYVAYIAIFLLGRRLGPNSSFVRLLGGGIFGAILFYLVTNFIAWLFNPFGNPEYTRDLIGLLTALTKGTAGYMETWEFFRNTLLSGGLFTALFAGTMKLSVPSESPLDKESPVPEEPSSEEPTPEEAKA